MTYIKKKKKKNTSVYRIKYFVNGKVYIRDLMKDKLYFYLWQRRGFRYLRLGIMHAYIRNVNIQNDLKRN